MELKKTKEKMEQLESDLKQAKAEVNLVSKSEKKETESNDSLRKKLLEQSNK